MLNVIMYCTLEITWCFSLDPAMGKSTESCLKTVQEMEGEERPHCPCDATQIVIVLFFIFKYLLYWCCYYFICNFGIFHSVTAFLIVYRINWPMEVN